MGNLEAVLPPGSAPRQGCFQQSKQMGYFFEAYLEERKRHCRFLWIRTVLGTCGIGLAILAGMVSYALALCVLLGMAVCGLIAAAVMKGWDRDLRNCPACDQPIYCFGNPQISAKRPDCPHCGEDLSHY